MKQPFYTFDDCHKSSKIKGSLFYISLQVMLSVSLIILSSRLPTSFFTCRTRNNKLKPSSKHGEQDYFRCLTNYSPVVCLLLLYFLFHVSMILLSHVRFFFCCNSELYYRALHHGLLSVLHFCCWLLCPSTQTHT